MTALFPNQLGKITIISRWPARTCRPAPSAWSSPASAPPCRRAALPSRSCSTISSTGVPSSAPVYGVAGGGQTFPHRPARRAKLGWRALARCRRRGGDRPDSPLVLYAGSGTATPVPSPAASPPTETAFWDFTHNPHVITSSFGFRRERRARPFTLPPASCSSMPPCATSRCCPPRRRRLGQRTRQRRHQRRPEPDEPLRHPGRRHVALHDALRRWPIRRSIPSPAPLLAGDHATIWQLVAGGLTVMPSAPTAAPPWSRRFGTTTSGRGTTLTGPGQQTGYQHNNASSAASTPRSPRPATRRLSASRR